MKIVNVRKGQQFGRWTLVERLDAGGNGLVWKCQSEDGVYAAIKFLQRPYDKNARRRFLDECTAMRACQTIAGVLPILDDDAEGKLQWIVTALAEPFDQAKHVSSLRDAVEISASLAATLAEMHAAGYSHRDLKPGNIFYLDGHWHLGDFGLISFAGKEQLTKEGRPVGARFYIAPEMANSPDTAIGSSADVYSLAMLLWKMASGQAYPQPMRPTETVNHLRTLLGDSRAASLDQLIIRATAHDPAQRLTASEFHRELTTWLTPTVTRGLDPSKMLEKLGQRIAEVEKPQISELALRQRMWAERSVYQHRLLKDVERAFGEAAALISAKVETLQDDGFHSLVRYAANPKAVNRERPQQVVYPIPGWVRIRREVPTQGGLGIIDSGLSFDFRVQNERNPADMWDEPIEIAAGHRLQVAIRGRRSFWLLSPQLMLFELGLPSQEQAISSAVDWVTGSLGGALNELLEELEVLGSDAFATNTPSIDVSGQTYRLLLADGAPQELTSAGSLQLFIRTQVLAGRSLAAALGEFQAQLDGQATSSRAMLQDMVQQKIDELEKRG
jgi:hypothetical protein